MSFPAVLGTTLPWTALDSPAILNCSCGACVRAPISRCPYYCYCDTQPDNNATTNVRLVVSTPFRHTLLFLYVALTCLRVGSGYAILAARCRRVLLRLLGFVVYADTKQEVYRLFIPVFEPERFDPEGTLSWGWGPAGCARPPPPSVEGNSGASSSEKKKKKKQKQRRWCCQVEALNGRGD